MLAGVATDFEMVLDSLRRGRQRIRLASQVGAYQRLPGTFFHPVPELFLQSGGATEFSCPGGDFSLETGELCLMPSGVPHGEIPRDRDCPYEIVVCWPVTEGFVVHRARKSSSGQIRPGEAAQVLSASGRHAFSRLEEAALPVRERYREDYLKSAMSMFVIVLLEELQRPAAKPSGNSPLVAGIVRQARPLLADPELSLGRLAVLAGCSPDHLSRRFRNEIGISLGKWITRERLAMARDLLRDRRMSVAEVGWASGFRAPSYFIRVFRDHTGLTPGAWRAARPEAGPG